MLGKDGLTKEKSPKSSEQLTEGTEKSAPSPTSLPAYMDDTDYSISNLTISRELGFIIGIAVPDVESKKQRKGKPKRSQQSNVGYLFTYNLKGNLIKCVEISVNVKERESTILLTSRDGEYIILTENCNSIKILRTFDLTPLYAFNTSDAPSSFQTDKIRSLNLVDLKYLLVGMENGKFLVYNIDFNRWNQEYNRY